MIQLGIDVLVKSASLQKELHKKRIGLLAHPASLTSSGQHSLDALRSLKKLTLTCGFGPQHGMRGDKQDNMVESPDYKDSQGGFPIYSLYGKTRRLTPAMLNEFDVLVVDLQDVGCRIYTYLTTLFYMMEDCARTQKELWVLDRPNPAGRGVEGMKLQSDWKSFVGHAEIPIRHGMTLGEMALWFKKKKNLDLNLTVVSMKGYQPQKSPGYGWPLLELPWINPSPNATTLSMARCYAGTVLLEGTTLSEGRGTTRPLEMVGAPDLDIDLLLKEMERLQKKWLKGCLIRKSCFEPTFHKHEGKLCYGIQFHVDAKNFDPGHFRPYRLMALFLKCLKKQNPTYPLWRSFEYEYEKDRLAFDLINGSPRLRAWIENPDAGVSDLETLLQKEEKDWLRERKPFLLYG